MSDTNEVDPRSAEQVFPLIPIAAQPLGNRVLVQLRKVRTQSAGGILYVADTKDTQKQNEVVAIVRAVGPLAYKSRDVETGELINWGEGDWVKPGDLVRVIKFSGDRWSEPHEDGHLNFIIINDRDCIARINSFEDAQKMLAFVE